MYSLNRSCSMSNTSISGSSSPFSNYQRRRLPAKVVALSTANRDHSNGSVLLDTRSGTTTLQEMRDGYAEVVDPKSGVTGGVQDIYGEDTATEDQPVTPWAVSVASGYSLLRDPHHNKGLAFNEKERDSHYLCGLLPPTVVSQELQVSFFTHQVKKMMHNIRNYQVPLQRYMAMMDLQERNQKLFYKLLMDNVEELLPIVYTATVGEACQKYRSIFK